MNKKGVLAMKRGSIFFAALMVALVLALSAVSTPAGAADDKVFRWRMMDPWAPGTIFDTMANKLTERIKAMSNGRLDIKMFSVDTIVGTMETFDAISKGVMEGHINVPNYWTGKIPAASIFCSTPMGISEPGDWMTWYYNRGGIDLIRPAYEKFNIRFVAPFIAPGNSPFYSRKPVKNIAEFKGLKLRTNPGLQSEVAKALGMSPVVMPVGDVYTAMETGVLDAVTSYTIYGWHKFGIQEVTKYSIEPGFMLPNAALEVALGMKAWNSLPPDLQAIFENAVKAWNNDFYAIAKDADLQSYVALKQTKMETLVLPDKDMEEISKIIIQTVDAYAAKDELSKKVWESQKQLMKELGRYK